MGVLTTSLPPEIVVDGAKRMKFQGGSWINKILYKFFWDSRRLSIST